MSDYDKTPDYIFECKKCGHNLYIGKKKEAKIETLPEMDCPECGEEGDRLWILIGTGDYKESGFGK